MAATTQFSSLTGAVVILITIKGEPMNKPKNRLSALAQWLCGVLLLAANANAQLNAGMIRGKVTDRVGAAVRGATVRLTNSITKYAQTAVTDNEGAYQLIDAPFNRYTLTVEASGFG